MESTEGQDGPKSPLVDCENTTHAKREDAEIEPEGLCRDLKGCMRDHDHAGCHYEHEHSHKSRKRRG